MIVFYYNCPLKRPSNVNECPFLESLIKDGIIVYRFLRFVISTLSDDLTARITQVAA